MLQNLRKLRQRKGISQQQLADCIGVTQQSVNKYENHKAEPDQQILMKLADFFDTSVDYLIGYTEIDHKIEPVHHADLTEQEMQVICSYRRLSEKQRHIIAQLVESIVE